MERLRQDTGQPHRVRLAALGSAKAGDDKFIYRVISSSGSRQPVGKRGKDARSKPRAGGVDDKQSTKAMRILDGSDAPRASGEAEVHCGLEGWNSHTDEEERGGVQQARESKGGSWLRFNIVDEEIR